MSGRPSPRGVDPWHLVHPEPFDPDCPSCTGDAPRRGDTVRDDSPGAGWAVGLAMLAAAFALGLIAGRLTA